MNWCIFKNFIREENAQASIEWYMMLGAAILAAITISNSYRKNISGNEEMYREIINDTYSNLCKYAANRLDVTGAELTEFCKCEDFPELC